MLLSIVAYSAGVFFKRANLFARESAMLKLQQICKQAAFARPKYARNASYVNSDQCIS